MCGASAIIPWRIILSESMGAWENHNGSHLVLAIFPIDDGRQRAAIYIDQ